MVSVRFRKHLRDHPDHVLVGRHGDVVACGTCRGVPVPENGLPWEYMTARERFSEWTRWLLGEWQNYARLNTGHPRAREPQPWRTLRQRIA